MKKLILMMAAMAWAAGPASGAEAKVDFIKDIQPILRESCIKCHGPEKQKGKLRLDSRDAAVKPAKGDPSIIAGDAAKSEFFRRVSLPKTDDDFMPSEGEPLTKAQLELIRNWINQGAIWPESAASAETKAGPATPPGPVLPADFKPSAAEQKAIAAFSQKGIDVRPIAMNLSWREANFRLHGTNVTDTLIAPIKDILGLVDLNLANTKITDAGLASLKSLANLQRLHLELTAVTDAGLVHLKGLPNLVYLNLYGTAVTDAGLAHLKDLKHLRNLYVWQTKTTEAGVQALKTALPNLDVSTGWDLSALAKKEEKSEEKPAEAKKEDKPAEKKADKPAEKKPAPAPKPAEKKDDSAAAPKAGAKPEQKPEAKPEQKSEPTPEKKEEKKP